MADAIPTLKRSNSRVDSTSIEKTDSFSEKDNTIVESPIFADDESEAALNEVIQNAEEVALKVRSAHCVAGLSDLVVFLGSFLC